MERPRGKGQNRWIIGEFPPYSLRKKNVYTCDTVSLMAFESESISTQSMMARLEAP